MIYTREFTKAKRFLAEIFPDVKIFIKHLDTFREIDNIQSSHLDFDRVMMSIEYTSLITGKKLMLDFNRIPVNYEQNNFHEIPSQFLLQKIIDMELESYRVFYNNKIGRRSY